MTGWLEHMLVGLLRGPETMDPADIEDRVSLLEAKVEANRVAIEEHERRKHREEADPER